MSKTRWIPLKPQLDPIISVSKERMRALFRQSIQDVIIDANTQTTKGGRMRRDTGFLTLSGTASFDGIPSGPTRGESREKDFYTSDVAGKEQFNFTMLEEFEPGSTFFYGWTARYAIYREAYDGFLQGAVEKWPDFVAANTERIRKEIQK